MKTIILLKSIFLLISFFLPSLLKGEVGQALSNIDGLSNNSVNCILEDKNQNIWIGTWDGLNMYDGRTIVSFRYSKSDSNTISNNVIRQIIEDGEYLWVTTDNGVNRINKVTKDISRYYLQHEVPTQENAYLIEKSYSGKLFCWVKGRGLFYYRLDTDDFVFSGVKLQDEVVDFKLDTKGNAFLLTSDGKVKYTQDKLLLQDKRVENFSMFQKQEVDQILSSNQSMVFVVSDTLFFIDENLHITDSVSIQTHKKVSSILCQDELVYIGLVGGGCIVYNSVEKKVERMAEIPSEIAVTSIYQGSQNVIWLGTDGKGVLQLLPYRSFFYTVEVPNPVRCFCENEKGDVWVGTKGSGIKYFNRKKQVLSDFLGEAQGLSSMSVYSLMKNKWNDVFIGTEADGIDIFYAEENEVAKLDIPKFYPLFQSVYSICFTNNDSLLWVGTSGYGLIKMNLEKHQGRYRVTGMKQYTSSDSPLNNDVVYAVVPDVSGKYVWFGTRGGGVNRVTISSDEILTMEDIYPKAQLTNNDVLSLLADEDMLWIGTSYGLNQLNMRDGRVIQYAEQLPNKTVHSIVQNKEGVWMGSNQGLLYLNKQTEKIEDYTLADGLHNNEFADGAAFRTEANELFFGGVNGFSYFQADNLHLRKFSPNLVLADLKIFNRSHDIDKKVKNGKLHLKYGERTFTLTFLAKEFIKNHNCEYAYRFRNQSSDWVNMENNPHISFTQLPPGKYILEVKCTNGDRVWGKHIYKLIIQIGYPWWFSMPAIGIYILFLGFAFYITKRIIVGRIRLSKQILIARVETAHERKMYESKLRFFMNVAHEFFTPLTLIYTPVQHLLEQKEVKGDTRKYLNLIKGNAERMQKLISELIEFHKAGEGRTELHIEQVNLLMFLKEVVEGYAVILSDNKIDFQVDLSLLNGQFCTDKSSLEKIVFNLLSNAFKYTPRGGYIEVKSYLLEDNKFYFEVKNSGKGLTQRQISEVFDRYKIFDTSNVEGSVSNGIGLNLTKRLVENLGGEILVDSLLGEYVVFKVILPQQPFPLLNTEKERIVDSEVQSKDMFSITQATILLVEDEEEVRTLLKSILKGYDVKEVSNGREALAYLAETHPDIILTDMIMKEMDGLTLTKKLKSDLKTNHIPIVMISGKSSVEDQIKACQCGVDAYITKPFHPLQISSIVENLITRHQLLKDYFNSSLSIVRKKEGYDLHPEDERLIKKMSDTIVEHIDDECLSSELIAANLGISKATLYRKLKTAINKTPNEFIREIRLDYAAKLLVTTQLTVTEIMYKCGFSNKSYFYREFLKLYGYSPKDYRNKQLEGIE